MVDHNRNLHRHQLQTVCCMCGDVGFSDKLFACTRCRFRSQHSYCSNYYSDQLSFEICDWCRSEDRNGNCSAAAAAAAVVNVVTSPRQTGSSGGRIKLSSSSSSGSRLDYSGERIKQRQTNQVIGAAGNASASVTSERPAGKSGVPSPRQSTRRYKLLKDVMC